MHNPNVSEADEVAVTVDNVCRMMYECGSNGAVAVCVAERFPIDALSVGLAPCLGLTE